MRATSLLLIFSSLLTMGVQAGTAGREEGREGEPAPPSRTEERVTVRDSAPRHRDPASFATRIDGEEIAFRGQDLADVLRRVPGARIHDYGGLGSYATISLRASTAEQVTVLVDGIPRNRATGGPVDLSSIPPTLIDEINVFRGFGPASLGLGGVGGVIDIRTRAAGDAIGFRVDALAGELDTQRMSASVSVPTGPARGLLVAAEVLTTDGDFLFLDTGGTYFDEGDDRLRHRRNNDAEHRTLQVSHAWDDLGPHRVRVGLRRQERDRGVPWVDNLPTGTARSEDGLSELTASWQRAAGEGVWDNELVLDLFDDDSRFHDPDGDFGVATDRHTELRGAGVGSVLRASLGVHRLTMRVDLREERADVRDELLQVAERGGAERAHIGATVEEMVTVGRFTLAPSIRWDYRRDDFVEGGSGTLPPQAPDVAEDEWSGKLGAVWAAGPITTIRGSLGRFYRAPSLRELFGNRGSLVGNPRLVAERGNAAELGVTQRIPGDRRNGVVDVVAFGRRTTDMIHVQQQSQGVSVAVNLADADVYGLEAAIDLDLGSGLILNLNGTWQRATDRSGGPFDGEPLAYTPELLGYAGLRWERDGWSAGWDVTYTGENGIDAFDTPELRLPERVIHDAVAGYEWPGGVRLTLDARNIFDRRTVDVARYPLPGRAVLVHLGWRSDSRGER